MKNKNEKYPWRFRGGGEGVRVVRGEAIAIRWWGGGWYSSFRL